MPRAASISSTIRRLGRSTGWTCATGRSRTQFHSVAATWTRCLILTFRYTAISDEKREGLAWLGFNLGTGAVLDEVMTRLRAALAEDGDWRLPEPEVRRAAASARAPALLASRLRPLLDDRLRRELGPFLRAMHRRLDRDRARVHALQPGRHAPGQTNERAKSWVCEQG